MFPKDKKCYSRWNNCCFLEVFCSTKTQKSTDQKYTKNHWQGFEKTFFSVVFEVRNVEEK